MFSFCWGAVRSCNAGVWAVRHREMNVKPLLGNSFLLNSITWNAARTSKSPLEVYDLKHIKKPTLPHSRPCNPNAKEFPFSSRQTINSVSEFGPRNANNFMILWATVRNVNLDLFDVGDPLRSARSVLDGLTRSLFDWSESGELQAFGSLASHSTAFSSYSKLTFVIFREVDPLFIERIPANPFRGIIIAIRQPTSACGIPLWRWPAGVGLWLRE